jgi:hypothetical protein
MVGSNYSQELRDRGLTVPGDLKTIWYLNLGIGGPIVKDRLWYFGGIRDEGSERGVPGMFANLNDGDPTKWTYVADTSRPASYAASFRMLSLRFTVQATPRNKFNVFWDEQMPCEEERFQALETSMRADGPGTASTLPGARQPPLRGPARPQRRKRRPIARSGTGSGRRSGRRR